MVRNTGTQLRNSVLMLSDSELAMHIGLALMSELGASRRATKTVMRWTGVSDRTAQKWLHGQTSPSGVHLIALAAESPSVFRVVLKLTGNADLEIGIQLREIEAGLEHALAQIHTLRRNDGSNLASN